MARVTHAAPHLSLTEVKHRMKADPRTDQRQRWLIIYNALVEPRKAEEIARHCGVSKATVHAVISRYNRLGVAAIETPGKGGRRRQYLTLEEEKNSSLPFLRKPSVGRSRRWRRSGARLNNASGTHVDDSTIYRLLHRHGWRKLTPRPRHPKSDLETQEQFKKTFQPRWMRQLPQKRRAMNVPCSSWRKTKAVLAASVVPNAVGHHLGCVPTPRHRWCASTSMPMLRWLRSWARWSH